MRRMRIPIAVTALLLLAPTSCKNHREEIEKELPPEPEAKAVPVKPMPAPPKKAPTPEELGSCKLTASGAVAKEQTTFGGRAATNVTYWMTEDEQKKLMGTDGFALNCSGPDIRFALIPSGKRDGMPFKPKKYAVSKGTGDATVTVGFGKLTLDGISGTVDVTEFDKRHIAGTIDVRGKLVPGGGEVKLTGTFDLKCPGFGGCES
jgi:hypothetical protein